MVNGAFSGEYNRIFAEGLKEFGFINLKNSDVFLRLMNDEILQQLYVLPIGSPSDKQFVFTIGVSIRSVYIERISKRKLTNTKISIYDLLSDEEKAYIPWQEYCYVCDTASLSNVITKALQDVVRVIIPVFDNIITIPDYIEYCLATDETDISFEHNSNESLVWVKAAEVLDYDRLAKALCGYTCALSNGERFVPEVAIRMKKEKLLEKYIDPLNRILADPIQLQKANNMLIANKKSTLLFLEKSLSEI